MEAEGCDGCSMMVDYMGHPAHLHARDTSLTLVSRAPLEKIAPFKARMGWTVPWYSSFGSDFNYDFGVTTDAGERFGLSVFLRHGDNVFQTYFTDRRGVEYLGSNWSYLDLTPLGRQETWENSPEGWPQTLPYEWWRHHSRHYPLGDTPTLKQIRLDRPHSGAVRSGVPPRMPRGGVKRVLDGKDQATARHQQAQDHTAHGSEIGDVVQRQRTVDEIEGRLLQAQVLHIRQTIRHACVLRLSPGPGQHVLRPRIGFSNAILSRRFR
jgi:hypothetical protein